MWTGWQIRSREPFFKDSYWSFVLLAQAHTGREVDFYGTGHLCFHLSWVHFCTESLTLHSLIWGDFSQAQNLDFRIHKRLAHAEVLADLVRHRNYRQIWDSKNHSVAAVMPPPFNTSSARPNPPQLVARCFHFRNLRWIWNFVRFLRSIRRNLQTAVQLYVWMTNMMTPVVIIHRNSQTAIQSYVCMTKDLVLFAIVKWCFPAQHRVPSFNLYAPDLVCEAVTQSSFWWEIQQGRAWIVHMALTITVTKPSSRWRIQPAERQLDVHSECWAQNSCILSARICMLLIFEWACTYVLRECSSIMSRELLHLNALWISASMYAQRVLIRRQWRSPVLHAFMCRWACVYAVCKKAHSSLMQVSAYVRCM